MCTTVTTLTGSIRAIPVAIATSQAAAGTTELHIAARIIENEPVFIPISVFLEVEWVLRALYRLPTVDVLRQLRAFARLPNVNVEHTERAMQALSWAEEGLDFADALHLAGARSCESFATFDRDFRKKAQRFGRPIRDLAAT